MFKNVKRSRDPTPKPEHCNSMPRVGKYFLQNEHFRLCGPHGLCLNADNTKMSGHDCVPLTLYFQSQVKDEVG